MDRRHMTIQLHDLFPAVQHWALDLGAGKVKENGHKNMYDM